MSVIVKNSGSGGGIKVTNGIETEYRTYSGEIDAGTFVSLAKGIGGYATFSSLGSISVPPASVLTSNYRKISNTKQINITAEGSSSSSSSGNAKFNGVIEYNGTNNAISHISKNEVIITGTSSYPYWQFLKVWDNSFFVIMKYVYASSSYLGRLYYCTIDNNNEITVGPMYDFENLLGSQQAYLGGISFFKLSSTKILILSQYTSYTPKISVLTINPSDNSVSGIKISNLREMNEKLLSQSTIGVLSDNKFFILYSGCAYVITINYSNKTYTCTTLTNSNIKSPNTGTPNQAFVKPNPNGGYTIIRFARNDMVDIFTVDAANNITLRNQISYNTPLADYGTIYRISDTRYFILSRVGSSTKTHVAKYIDFNSDYTNIVYESIDNITVDTGFSNGRVDFYGINNNDSMYFTGAYKSGDLYYLNKLTWDLAKLSDSITPATTETGIQGITSTKATTEQAGKVWLLNE